MRQQPLDYLIKEEGHHQFTISIHLDPNLFWFKGHFPEKKIFPGVAQINWVMYYINHCVSQAYHLAHIEWIKFQKPLYENDDITLSFQVNTEIQQCLFKYYRQQVLVSSGKLTLNNYQLEY